VQLDALGQEIRAGLVVSLFEPREQAARGADDSFLAGDQFPHHLSRLGHARGFRD